MLGWELPPHNSGGLGTASLGLTEGLAPLGVSIRFVLPKLFGPLPYTHMTVVDATKYGTPADLKNLNLGKEIDEAVLASTLAYGNHMTVDEKKRFFIKHLEAGDIHQVPAQTQANWYAKKAGHIAKKHQDFDVIHTHDWMTYYGGMEAQKVAKKTQGRHVPIIAHVHATEIDRCGVNGDPAIIEIERKGLHAADRVVAVSQYTKEIIHKHYGVPKEKISVVYNGIPTHKEPAKFDLAKLKEKYKIVLFMGRITMQKGPDYFVKLAKAVTDKDPNVRFIMVGSGDMEKKCIEDAARAGLTGKMLFSSFLRGVDVDRAYQLADLFVMPSTSEPFGIVALEAVQNGTPVLVSKQSGVAEVTENMIKVDFWDIPKMTEEVLHVLNTPGRSQKLRLGALKDLTRLTWNDAGKALYAVYDDVDRLARA
jgi:glycosyltransferase involved in cell wall biosynthesis